MDPNTVDPSKQKMATACAVHWYNIINKNTLYGPLGVASSPTNPNK